MSNNNFILQKYFSGGCGAMYEISVVTQEFKGLSIVKQHRLINEVKLETVFHIIKLKYFSI